MSGLSASVQAAMKASGLPTAQTPQLDPSHPFNDPVTKMMMNQELELHHLQQTGQLGGAVHRTHVVIKGGKRKYVVRLEGKKKYIQCNNKKMYLSDMKGKYSYV